MIDKPWPREVATDPILGTIGSILVFSAQVGAVMAIEGFVLTERAQRPFQIGSDFTLTS